MGARLLFAVTLANRAATLGSQLAVGAFLMPEAVGLWAVAVGWAGMLSPVQSADFARLSLQAPADGPEDRERVDRALLRWLLLGWGAGFTVAVLAGGTLADAAWPLLLAMAALALPRVLVNRRITALARTGASSRIAWANGAEGMTRAILLIATAWAGCGPWSFAIAEAGALGAAFATSGGAAGSATGAATGDAWRLPAELVRKFAITGAISLLVAIELGAVPVLLARALSEATAGSYFFAFRLAGQIPILLLPLMLHQALPALIRLRDDPIALDVERRSWQLRFWLLAGGLGAAATLAGPPLIRLLWGDRWAVAADLLQVLGATLALRSLYAFAKAQLEAAGAYGRILALSVLDVAMIAGCALGGAALGATAMQLVAALAVEAAVMTGLGHWLAGRAFSPAGRTAAA